MSDVALTDPVQQGIADEFGFFGDWSERYQYLMNTGRKSAALPPRNGAPRRTACMAASRWSGSSMKETPTNSSSTRSRFLPIVSGLIALTLRVYSGRSAAEILACEPLFIEAMGLGKHLSVTRANGLAALIARIKDTAAKA